ncbi:MAG: PH domain-containing protein [Verrucomicrobiota bacterium]|nr:PH domain-containing protein [Verrucomicrobiota bacterium]
MFNDNTFSAPWGRSLKLTTRLCLAVVFGIFLIGVIVESKNVAYWKIGMLWIPAGLLLVSYFFSIRNYQLIESKLYIRRIGWKYTIDLANLESVQVDPSAMSKSIRLFGNGGLFCFAGIFRNHKLGRYRAFAASSKNSVILRFPNRTIVVTPEDPDGFAEMIQAQLLLN